MALLESKMNNNDFVVVMTLGLITFLFLPVLFVR